MSDDDLTAAYLLARKDADDEIKALRAEIERLREEAERLRAERDIARRMYCRALTDFINPYRTPKDTALDRGWDCFKEKTNE